jgi:hypothetical protein
MSTNLTVRYSDLSDANGALCWDGKTSNANGRLSNNAFGDYGPPTSSSNWLPIIEYKQNASGKTTYQSMNCTAINQWDVLQGIDDRSYKNVTTRITEPGVTILVDAGYTPNGKCYYCHVSILKYADGSFKFPNTTHWTEYNNTIQGGSLNDPYTPGRCIDCHNKTDSEEIPHGNISGKDLLDQPSPQLCYNGRTGDQTCHNSSTVRETLNQKEEFGKTTHHPLGDGKLACKACHDNHGSKYRYDLLKYYTNATSGGYDSANYALCFVCHLEEKIVAKMSDETDYLTNYSNQTNFRDEYYCGAWGTFSYGGIGGTPKFKNIHSPQNEINNAFYDSVHPNYNCYSCHNPHGSDYPATTRYEGKKSKTETWGVFNYTYITNVSPPNNIIWGELDYANWNDSAMNRGGGTSNSNCGGCHGTFKLQSDFFAYRTYVNYTPAGGAGCLECHDNNASPYNTTPIRPIVNLTAVKLAMHTNLSWNFRNGGFLNVSGTNETFRGWLDYRGYTGKQIDNITEDNAICWACHSTNGTPPSPGFHPDRTMTPYKCPKCHHTQRDWLPQSITMVRPQRAQNRSSYRPMSGVAAHAETAMRRAFFQTIRSMTRTIQMTISRCGNGDRGNMGTPATLLTGVTILLTAGSPTKAEPRWAMSRTTG